MATTGIWKIEKRLDHVIKYTANVEKTINEDYSKNNYMNLHNVIDYIEADYKTEKQYYVSGINCSIKNAMEEMIITKRRFDKTDGILGFHAFQSFKEGEVTPKQAHDIGLRLAEEMWGDRFEVLVSTHLNTKHIHNHFVLNSVSFVDGKKYYDKRETYARLRQLSDAICEEFGISFLKEKKCRRSKINYSNYYKKDVERSNYHTIAKEDVDRAILQAYSYRDFENLMKKMDYELIYRAGKLSVKRYPYKKNIRISRAFGEEYTVDNIINRIDKEQALRIPFIEEYGIKKSTRKDFFINTTHKKSKLYKLYLHYCYLLKKFPQRHPNKRLPASIRADVIKMETISEEAKLLNRYKINTYEQFLLFKNEKKYNLNDLKDKRDKLWYKHKIVTIDERKEVRNEIDNLTKSIEELRREVVLFEGIEKRTHKIENNLEELDKQNLKEKEGREKDNEFIR